MAHYHKFSKWYWMQKINKNMLKKTFSSLEPNKLRTLGWQASSNLSFLMICENTCMLLFEVFYEVLTESVDSFKKNNIDCQHSTV